MTNIHDKINGKVRLCDRHAENLDIFPIKYFMENWHELYWTHHNSEIGNLDKYYRTLVFLFGEDILSTNSEGVHLLCDIGNKNILNKSLDKIKKYYPHFFEVIQSNPKYFGIKNTYVP